jgi:hypothetical protein
MMPPSTVTVEPGTNTSASLTAALSRLGVDLHVYRELISQVVSPRALTRLGTPLKEASQQ